MKRAFNLATAILLLVSTGTAQNQGVTVKVVNPLALDRPGEMVELRWSELTQLLPSLTAASVMVKDASSGKELLSQTIDENQDGVPDLLIVRVDIPAKGSQSLIIFSTGQKKVALQSMTDARFVLPREDLAWENDRIAYRMYGPALAKEVNNGIDVWTKRVRYLIVEKWYKANEGNTSGRDTYHEDHGEGADFFSVGQSLGAGSCALFKDDSLHQPGVFTWHKIISTGPLRAMFELTYKPVQFDGKTVSETKRVTLDAGVNLNKIEVIYRSDNSGGVVSFAAGIVKRKGVTSYSDPKNPFVSLWGLTTEKEENGYLSTGIVMGKEIFKAVKEDKTHLLMVGTATLGKPVVYYAGAGWTRSGDFRSAEEWNQYLKDFSMRNQSPLEISHSVEK